jgi:hypothetical protein
MVLLQGLRNQLFISAIVPGFFTAGLLIAFGLCYVFMFNVGRPSPRVSIPGTLDNPVGN